MLRPWVPVGVVGLPREIVSPARGVPSQAAGHSIFRAALLLCQRNLLHPVSFVVRCVYQGGFRYGRKIPRCGVARTRGRWLVGEVNIRMEGAVAALVDGLDGASGRRGGGHPRGIGPRKRKDPAVAGRVLAHGSPGAVAGMRECCSGRGSFNPRPAFSPDATLAFSFRTRSARAPRRPLRRPSSYVTGRLCPGCGSVPAWILLPGASSRGVRVAEGSPESLWRR